MIGDTSGYSWSTPYPIASASWQEDGNSKATMIRAKVIDRANQIHRRVQSRRLTCQGPASPDQGKDAGTEGGIQPFDVRGVDRASPLGLLHQSLHLSGGPLHQALMNGNHPFA